MGEMRGMVTVVIKSTHSKEEPLKSWKMIFEKSSKTFLKFRLSFNASFGCYNIWSRKPAPSNAWKHNAIFGHTHCKVHRYIQVCIVCTFKSVFQTMYAICNDFPCVRTIAQSTYVSRVQSSVWRLPKYWHPTPSPPAPKAGWGGTHSPGGEGVGVNILEDARNWIGLLQYNPSSVRLVLHV